MFKETLSSILNVEVYAIIGFFIFFTFFIFVSFQAYRMKKEEVDQISNMPLEDSVSGDRKMETGIHSH
jgi:cytochrome c oxidase cbb3-type subunit IV